MKCTKPILLLALFCLAACTKDDIQTTDTPEQNQTILADPGLEWKTMAFVTAINNTGDDFPTLSNPHDLSVQYSSSDSSVAAIDRNSGEITLIAAGSTTITATSEATDTYAHGEASYLLTVVGVETTLQSAGIAWSATSCQAILESNDNSYPTLSNPNALSVHYKTTDATVATISSTGELTLHKIGTTTVIATTEETETYAAGSASYNLQVISSTDTGIGTYTFPSTGDSSSEDDIVNTTFTRQITITWTSSGASVEGDAYGYVSVSGGNVTVQNSGSEFIVYKLTGTSSNGSFTLYSARKQAILLSDLTLTCPTGAAINNQSPKRTFLLIEGSNTLKDSSSASYTTSGDEDMKAVVFSEGQLVISGGGSLTVNALNKQGKSGLTSDDYVRVMKSPNLLITTDTSAGHGLRGQDHVQISDGHLSVTTSAAMKKAIGSDNYVLIEGGTTSLIVSGGVAYDSDDAEYKGSAGIKADNYFAMTGGTVTIKNSGAGGKGISAGSYTYDATTHVVADSYITGGTLTINCTGSESNDVSAKGIKIGWVTKNGSGDHATVTGNAGNLRISGGNVMVTCSKSEALEVKGDLTISGGSVYAYSTGDDAINSQGELDITGGYVYAHSTQNDALDTNHDLKISGGYVFAITTKGAPEVAIDANTEGGYKLYIQSGATVVAYGGLENNYQASQSVYSMSCSAGNWNALHDGSKYIAAFKAPSGISSVAVSAPNLSKGYTGVTVSGDTYCNAIWATSGISGGTSVSLSTYSGGGGGPGGGGHHW